MSILTWVWVGLVHTFGRMNRSMLCCAEYRASTDASRAEGLVLACPQIVLLTSPSPYPRLLAVVTVTVGDCGDEWLAEALGRARTGIQTAEPIGRSQSRNGQRVSVSRIGTSLPRCQLSLRTKLASGRCGTQAAGSSGTRHRVQSDSLFIDYHCVFEIP